MKRVKYLLLILSIFLLVGCFNSGKTYEYKTTNTGETIKVTIDKDYTLSETEPIKVTKDNAEVASIIFITKTNFDELKTLFSEKKLAAIKQGNKDNGEFYLYKVGEEYNYVITIDGTNSAAAVTSKEEATLNKIADNIKFSK